MHAEEILQTKINTVHMPVNGVQNRCTKKVHNMYLEQQIKEILWLLSLYIYSIGIILYIPVHFVLVVAGGAHHHVIWVHDLVCLGEGVGFHQNLLEATNIKTE